MHPEPDSQPRERLIAHLRQQIERNPEAYANGAKLRCVADKLLQEAEDQDESQTEQED